MKRTEQAFEEQLPELNSKDNQTKKRTALGTLLVFERCLLIKERNLVT
jgi:hypothetical protein